MSSEISPKLLAFVKQAASTPVTDAAWEQLAAAGNHEAALGDIETELLASPEDPLLRLWWTQCQLELGRLPITALTAPLEEIAKSVQPKPELHALCTGTLVKAAVGVIKKNQFRLGVGLLERALELAQGSLMVSATNIQEIRKTYRTIITEEIKRAPARKEPKSYLDLLEKKLAAIETNIEDNAPPSIPPVEHPVRKPVKRLDAKSMLVEAAAARSGVPEDADFSEPRRRPATLLYVCAAIATLLIAAVSVYQFAPQSIAGLIKRSPLGAESGAQTAVAMTFPQERKLAAPALDNRETADGQSLDSVGKRLAQLSITTAKENTEARSAKSMAEDPEIDHGALNSDRAKKLPKNTPSDDEVVSLTNLPEAENAIKEKKPPMYDPGKLGRTEVQPVGTSDRKSPIPRESLGGMTVDSNGRVYGPPKSSTGSGSPGAGSTGSGPRRALDGGPLQTYEVEQFNPPLLYRTITSTEVLSAPSLVSSALARLENDTPVHVSAKLGQWLELRSTGGKVGYIYAQDATPSK